MQSIGVALGSMSETHVHDIRMSNRLTTKLSLQNKTHPKTLRHFGQGGFSLLSTLTSFMCRGCVGLGLLKVGPKGSQGDPPALPGNLSRKPYIPETKFGSNNRVSTLSSSVTRAVNVFLVPKLGKPAICENLEISDWLTWVPRSQRSVWPRR